MKTKMIKNSLITSAFSLLLCISMLVGTTFAWFTDSATSANNIVQAGNLDVEFEYSSDLVTWNTVDAGTNVFKPDARWEPGYAEVIYLRVSNLGSLALKYELGVFVADETAGVNKAGESFKLSDYIEYGIMEGVTATYADRTAAIGSIDAASKLNTPYNKEFPLEAKTATATDSDVFALVVYMPETVGNEANHDGINAPTLNLGLSVIATQLAYESDSFGTNYDAESTYPTTHSLAYDDNTVPGNLYTENVKVTLAAGTAMGDYTLNVSNMQISTDANGKTTVAYDIDLSKDGTKITDDGTEYLVSIKVGAGLDIAEVLHNGEAITNFNYNPTEEYVTFTTTSFSPFAVSYTPYPANAVYVNTAEAFTAAVAADDAFIVLTDDVTLDAALTVNKVVTIDLCGNTLATRGLKFAADANVKNGNITSAASTQGIPHIGAAGGTLTMDNVNVVIDDYLGISSNIAELSAFDVTNATAVLNNCSIKAINNVYRANNYTYGVTMINGTLVMNGGELVVESAGAIGSNLVTGVCAIQTCTVTLNNVDVDSVTLGTTMGHLIINTTHTEHANANFVSYNNGTYEVNIIN